MQYALLGSGGYGEAGGVVRIGAGEIAAASCLPAFVAGLKADMPNIGLETEIDLTANLIQQLLTGRTDMAFAAGPNAHPALKTSPIGEVATVWLARPTVPSALAGGEGRLQVWYAATHLLTHGRSAEVNEASI